MATIFILCFSGLSAASADCTLDCRVQSPSSPHYVFTAGTSFPFTVVPGPSGSCTTIYNYFDFGDGTSPKDGTINNFTHTYSTPGFYDWTYRAYENKTGGAQCTKTGTFLIVPTDCSVPSCSATATSTPGSLTVAFSATASLGHCDPSWVVHYRWWFGDGTYSDQSDEGTASHTYVAPGDYRWNLQVGVGPKEYFSYIKCEQTGTVHVQTQPCLQVGQLKFCADSISDPDPDQNRTLHGNVSVNGTLRCTQDAIFKGDPASGSGTFSSQGDFSVSLAGGATTVLTGPETFGVEGAHSQMTPSLEPYFAFDLDGVTLYQAGAPFTFVAEGLNVKPEVTIGNRDTYALASLDANLLLPPGGALQIQDATVSKVFDPVYIAANPQLTYAGGKLGGTLDLLCPSFSQAPIRTLVKAQGGGICALDAGAPVPVSNPILPNVAWTNWALSLENICNGPGGSPPLKGVLHGDLYRTDLDPKFFYSGDGEYVRLAGETALTCRLRKGTLRLPLGELTVHWGYLQAVDADMVLEAVGAFGGSACLEGLLNPLISLPYFGSSGKMQYIYQGAFKGSLHIRPPYCDDRDGTCPVLVRTLRDAFGGNPWDLQDLTLGLAGRAFPFDQTWEGIIGGYVNIGGLDAVVLVKETQKPGPRLTIALTGLPALPAAPRTAATRVPVERGFSLPAQEDWAIFSAQGQAAVPSIYLKLPSGDTVTPANVSNYPGVRYSGGPEDNLALFIVQAAPAGTWVLGEDNLPEGEVALDAIVSAPRPALDFQSVTQEAGSVAITCAFTPATAGAKVSLFYGTSSDGSPRGAIATGLAADSGTVQTVWDTSSLPSGTYYLSAWGEDAIRPTTVAQYGHPLPISRPGPEPPTTLTGILAGDTATLSWAPSPSPSVSGYTILTTDKPQSEGYTWALEATSPTGGVLCDLDPERNYRFAVVAHDAQGNRSAPSNSWETALCAVEASPEVPAFAGKTQTVVYKAHASVAHCAGETAFDWDFGDGNHSSQENPERGYSAAGAFPWTLRVTAGGNTESYSGVILITEAKSCSLTCSAIVPGTAKTGEPVPFWAGSAASWCMGQAAYSWDFGDGTPGADSAEPTHIYTRAGTYTWTATASLAGNVCVTSRSVAITAGLPGDCDGDGTISIGEVQKAINMFLGTFAPGCGVDCNGDGTVSIGEVQKVINGFLGTPGSC